MEVCGRRAGAGAERGAASPEREGPAPFLPAHPALGVPQLASRPRGSGYIRELSGARETGPDRRAAGSARGGGRPTAPEPPHPKHTDPTPPRAPAKSPPKHRHGLLHRERLFQARRRHPRHSAGRSRGQRGRCQNPGEFPGPHGEEEDKERRARPEGPGPRGAGRSRGRPGRRGRRLQRRLGQVRRAGRRRQGALLPQRSSAGPRGTEGGRGRWRGVCRKLKVGGWKSEASERVGVEGAGRRLTGLSFRALTCFSLLALPSALPGTEELSIFEVPEERWTPRPLRSHETSLPCLCPPRSYQPDRSRSPLRPRDFPRQAPSRSR